jgi:hypothetical protein
MLKFMAELSLKVRQLVFQYSHTHHYNVLRMQSSRTLHIEEEFIWLSFPSVWSLICNKR